MMVKNLNINDPPVDELLVLLDHHVGELLLGQLTVSILVIPWRHD